jgi:pimeloyl-ACP methyl ester carboxylesterase
VRESPRWLPGDTARLYHELTSYSPEREWTAIPGARLVVQPGTGHCPHWELPMGVRDGRMARRASLPLAQWR